MPQTGLKKIIEAIPFSPGVYIMKDCAGRILYIGKARSLRKRVRSYLRVGPDLPKIRILMNKVADVDYVETPTEVDALLLEAELIRKIQPPYNKELKDDKSFPLLKITGERFARLQVTRKKNDPKAAYYGPYTDAKLLREAVTLIQALFPIRKCQTLPKTACLYYHIGQCLAPCIKSEVKAEYDRVVREVKSFLGGGKKSFIQYLTERMRQAAGELRYEDAQYFKEQIDALARLRRKRFLPKAGRAGVALSATLELKKVLRLERLPEKIVCFDVSNFQGDEAVASKAAFYRELADKTAYRRYKIRGVGKIDDYAMIQEALRRMLSGLKEGREVFFPDLILIDGGRGHLNAAGRVLAAEGFGGLALISIAKQFETVHAAHFTGEVPLERDSPGLHLLQKVRDEAHRFAVGYHRLLKEKGLERSALDEIPGIGEKRKRILLAHFDSLDELKRAGAEHLATLAGIDKESARRIAHYFKGSPEAGRSES